MMQSYIFNTNDSIFMGSKRNENDCKIALYSVPYDGTTSFRPGARFGPSAIRNVSSGIECYCPELELDLEEINFVDYGSLEIPHGDPKPVINLVRNVTDKFLENNVKPILLGGEHSITIGAVTAAINHYSDLVLIQLDAHADLRDKWLGSKYNHACVMKRCLEVLPSNQMFQVGIRSGTREEFQSLKESKRLIKQATGEAAIYLENALKPLLGKPIYLTIDLDWFDPSVLPGTGTPEPGGFYWNDFSSIISILKKHKIVAADVVELAPQLDDSGISSILAAKVVRSLIMLLSL